MSALKLVTADDDLARLSDDELLAKLNEVFELTVSFLVSLARLYREAKRRKMEVSVSRFKTGLASYVPQIAAGTVVPEAVVAFAGYLTVLRKVSMMPPDEQRRLAADGTVEVAVKGPDGQPDRRMMPFSAILASPEYLRLVLGDRCVRTWVEQVAILTAPPPAASSPVVTMGNVVVKRRDGVVKIGRAVAPLRDVVDALKAAGVTI